MNDYTAPPQGLLEQDVENAWLELERLANHRWRGRVTPAKRAKGVKRIANTNVRSPAERHVAMSWAQRLKRVFNINVEVCGHCGGSAKVIACIDDQDVIDSILAHLREKEQGRPTLSHLAPPPEIPLGHYLFLQDANSQPQISKDATEKRMAQEVACYRSKLDGYALCDHSHRQTFSEAGLLALIFLAAVTRIDEAIFSR